MHRSNALAKKSTKSPRKEESGESHHTIYITPQLRVGCSPWERGESGIILPIHRTAPFPELFSVNEISFCTYTILAYTLPMFSLPV
jgi:hypothetical protein